MQVAAGEHGQVHVFAVNRPADEIRRANQHPETAMDRVRPAPALLARLTGIDDLDPRGAELIPVADLAGIGLAGYLAEGHEIAPDDLAPLRARLDGLEGYVLILRSAAFGGRALRLAETADLTHVASFSQPGADWRGDGPMTSQAARPHSGPPRSPRAARHRAQRLGGLIVAGVLLAIAALLWLVLA